VRPKHLLAAGIILGIAGDLLLRMAPWGAGAALWWLSLIAVTIWLSGRHVSRTTALAAVIAAIAATGLVWRESEPLTLLNVAMLLSAVALLSLPARRVDVFAATVGRATLGVIISTMKAIAGFPQLMFMDVQWREEADSPRRKAVVTWVRGVLLALPLLLIFGGLLVSADAQFAKLISNFFNFDLAEMAGHVFVTGIVAAICCGYLRSATVPSELPDISRPAVLTLPAPELNIALGLLDALFGLFILVQARYLFGGTETVMLSPGLTLSEYARRGFFELAAVAALVVPLLLLTGSLVNRSSPRASRTFTTVATLQVFLVLAIEASAFYRMQLYQREFGWTEARLYTTAFMLWLVFLLAWLAATVLRSRFDRFLGAAIVSALIAVVVLHAINPDDLIVRSNVARAREGRRPLDAAYVTQLSADAIPALLASFDSLAPDQRSSIATRWLRRTVDVRPDWRTWNVSRRRGRELVLLQREKLEPYRTRRGGPLPSGHSRPTRDGASNIPPR
jgi:hypothetical protein